MDKSIKFFDTDTYADLNFNIDFGNYNPDDIEIDQTINAVFVIDVSPSVETYMKELNAAFNDFVNTMQRSHVAERLLASVVLFNGTVKPLTGFQPIANVSKMDFRKHIGGSTALYDGVLAGLRNALDYRATLENSGVETKTLLFVITDGEDNSSKNPPHLVKKLIDSLNKDERSAFSFTSVLFGVGNDSSFDAARKAMGIHHLARIGTSGSEIRKMIGFISQSISSTAAGKAAPSPDF